MPKTERQIVEGFDVPANAPTESPTLYQPPPPEIPVVVVAPVVVEPEEVLPTGLKAAFNLFEAASKADVDQERDAEGNVITLSREEVRRRKARLKRVGAHFYSLQQGPARVELIANDLPPCVKNARIPELAERIRELAS